LWPNNLFVSRKYVQYNRPGGHTRKLRCILWLFAYATDSVSNCSIVTTVKQAPHIATLREALLREIFVVFRLANHAFGVARTHASQC